MSNQKRPFIGLRSKAMLIAAVVCVIGISVSNYYISSKAEKLLYRYKLERMEALGRTFSANAEYGVFLQNKTLSNKICYGVTKEPDVLFAILFDSDGKIFAGNYVGLPQKYFGHIRERITAMADEMSPNQSFVSKDLKGGNEFIIQPIYSDKIRDASRFGLIYDAPDESKELIGYSVVIFTLKNIRMEIQRVRMMVAGMSIVALLLLVALFYVLATIPIRHLRKLLEAIKLRGRGDFKARVEVKTLDEIGQLGEGFNKMAEDLNKVTVSRDLLIKETAAREKAQNTLLRESMDYEKKLEEDVELKTQELKTTLNKLKKASLETIYRLSLAAEYRDRETGKHLLRMSHYAAAIARRLGLDKRYVEAILYASLMHDVGKIGISDTILLKPGKLTPYEWDIMKQHTVIGAKLLQDSEAEFIDLARNIALTHHERWDGTGYPQGLKGEDIDLAGRITAVADVFDAVMSERPYKEAFSIETAFEVIKQGRGTHFDPKIVDVFLEIKDEIISIMSNDRLLNTVETIISNGNNC